jgi:DNA-binding NtrC family response regulator
MPTREHPVSGPGHPGRRHPRLLVVDDAFAERDGLARLVGDWGYDVEAAASAEEALTLVERECPDVVITDLVLPRMDGLDLLRRLRETPRPPIVLLLTGHGSVETAVEAMRRGAADFLTKPVDTAQLQRRLEKAVERATLHREARLLRDRLREDAPLVPLAGESPAMQEVRRWIDLAASSTAPVLIVGESGTGKELVARTIHERSASAGGAFVTVNCAAIPETLIESEIFGHEKGAFTGASERRLGCFELADGGTLLLDEISEMDVVMQAKLLRVLQEASFRRLGGTSEIRVDTRIVSATNRDPEQAVAHGKLRQDLFYRINVFTILLPPLRERVGDVRILARRFIEEFNTREGREVEGLTPEAEAVLTAYSWPGNVRELRNVLHRAVVLGGAGRLRVQHLPEHLRGEGRPTGPGEETVVRPFREMEHLLITRALATMDYDKRRAAAALGISLKTLYNKLARYGIPLAKPGIRDGSLDGKPARQ